VIFVFINGPREVIEARIASRKGHYMPPRCSTRSWQRWSHRPPMRMCCRSISAEPQEEVAGGCVRSRAASALSALKV
jgi:gluconate kinase